MSRTEVMLHRHRRALGWAVLLLAAGVVATALVGRHPPEVAPLTTVPAIGELDASVQGWMVQVRSSPLTWICTVFSVLGSGIVTIPLRVLAVAVLALRRRWLQFIAFALTWLVAESAIFGLKAFFHRGRPPASLVETVGYSFPSGHALGVTATSVALVLAFFPTGRRRRWEWIAIAYAFVMSVSRVYLAAHWLSDVVVGTLLGAGIAIFVAASATEVRDLVFGSEGKPIPDDADDPEELLRVRPGG